MRFGIVRFPGSNCDEDCFWAAGGVLKKDAVYLWHQDKDLKNSNCIILPGGFSYGDYLRVAAVAKTSPIMQSIMKFAAKGGMVLGICNGFQVLCEAGLLPGAFLKNTNQQFICRDVFVKVININTPFTSRCKGDNILKIPIAHGEGRFYADKNTLNKMYKKSQVILKYCSPEGIVNEDSNPNGSVDNIAGICNLKKNVFGLMPHPERCCEEILGSSDGIFIFNSILDYLRGQK